jgi:pSer/pThr/pTyr-binding forkhead associated (FHA) protein
VQTSENVGSSTVAASGERRGALTIQVGHQSYTVHHGQAPIIIGRDPSAHISINDEHVSRVHLRIEETTVGWVAVDESRSGLFIAGTRQPQAPISDGTTIHLGHPQGSL